jgi:uncharacterized membrane protein
MVLILGVPAAIVLGLIPGPRMRRLVVLGLVWYVGLAAQTAYLAHPGVTGFLGVQGMDAVQGHFIGYWLTQPIIAAVLVVVLIRADRLRVARLAHRPPTKQAH